MFEEKGKKISLVCLVVHHALGGEGCGDDRQLSERSGGEWAVTYKDTSFSWWMRR